MLSKTNVDRLLAIALGLLGLGFVLQSYSLEATVKWDILGPGAYPRYVGLVIIGLAAILLVGTLRSRGEQPDSAASDAGAGRVVVTTFLSLGAYVAALPLLGFVIATPVFLFGLQYYFASDRSKWKPMAITAVVTTLVVFYLFENVLNVYLPRLG